MTKECGSNNVNSLLYYEVIMMNNTFVGALQRVLKLNPDLYHSTDKILDEWNPCSKMKNITTSR